MQSKGEILIYKAKDGSQHLEVKLDVETVWLSQKQMAELFGRDRVAIYSAYWQHFQREGVGQEISM